MKVEIISVGKGLVSGKRRDRNSSYMAEKLSGRGIVVRRITLVDDDCDDIVSVIRNAAARRTKILLIHGSDDRTFQGVAEASGVRLLADPEALRMVKRKFGELFARGLVPYSELTPERLKMATVPSGATILENPVGVAPGIKMNVGPCTVYCLPGAPEELEGLFDGTVFPEILLLFGGGAVVVRRIQSRFGDESVISEIIDRVKKKYPPVFMKPKTERSGKNLKISVEFIGADEEKTDVSPIESAVSYFRKLEEDTLKRS